MKNTLLKLTNNAKYYYKSKLFDYDEFQEDFQKAYLARKFLIKLDSNKDVNVILLSNHLISLYNNFDKNFITMYLYYYIEDSLKPYLKTILLFLNKISLSNKLFQNVKLSYDFDYLLKSIKN